MVPKTENEETGLLRQVERSNETQAKCKDDIHKL